jgi:hypothetical protein
VRAATTKASNLGNPISSIETRSAPALLGATHRAFTFYLGNPISSIPVFLIEDFAELRVLRGEIESHFSAAAAARGVKRRPVFQTWSPRHHCPIHSIRVVCSSHRQPNAKADDLSAGWSNTRGADALCELEVE